MVFNSLLKNKKIDIWKAFKKKPKIIFKEFKQKIKKMENFYKNYQIFINKFKRWKMSNKSKVIYLDISFLNNKILIKQLRMPSIRLALNKLIFQSYLRMK